MTSKVGVTHVMYDASTFRFACVVCQANSVLLVLREREDEQRAPLAGAEHPGQDPLGPGPPAGRHGDVLPAVDAVAARAAVVAAAALELPQQLPALGVEGVELARRLAAEDEVAARGQHGGAHRDVVAPAPPLLSRHRVERA